MLSLKTVLFFSFSRVVLGELVVVILTQQNQFHSTWANTKAQIWRDELGSSNQNVPIILSSSPELELDGAASWTIIPLLPKLAKYKGSWFLFVSEETQVNFTSLEHALAPFDPTTELFLGHSLSDSQPTIVHHFVSAGSISYPLLPAGFILSRPAILRLARHADDFNTTFNIDPPFEFAVFLRYYHSPSPVDMIPDPPPATPTALLLKHFPQLCSSAPPLPSDGSCATVYSQDIPECPVPVVMETWAPHVQGSIAYYSESEDREYSTIDIGVQNTERGHCAKTFAIIDNFHAYSVASGGHSMKWLVIADDDTLLGVPRLLRLLRCYDHTHPILLGEVYGFEAQKSRGYSYVTGGGGMVLSQGAVSSLVASNHKCPSPDYPDDMYLGSVAKWLHWDIIHSPLFHQSQPSTFPATVLELQTAISFHRHSPLDPVMVYHTYLQDHTSDKHNHKTEL